MSVTSGTLTTSQQYVHRLWGFDMKLKHLRDLFLSAVYTRVMEYPVSMHFGTEWIKCDWIDKYQCDVARPKDKRKRVPVIVRVPSADHELIEWLTDRDPYMVTSLRSVTVFFYKDGSDVVADTGEGVVLRK